VGVVTGSKTDTKTSVVTPAFHPGSEGYKRVVIVKAGHRWLHIPTRIQKIRGAHYYPLPISPVSGPRCAERMSYSNMCYWTSLFPGNGLYCMSESKSQWRTAAFHRILRTAACASHLFACGCLNIALAVS
jgi:hypothetical protein